MYNYTIRGFWKKEEKKLSLPGPRRRKGGGYGEAEDYTGICLPGGGKEVDQEIEF